MDGDAMTVNDKTIEAVTLAGWIEARAIEANRQTNALVDAIKVQHPNWSNVVSAVEGAQRALKELTELLTTGGQPQ